MLADNTTGEILGVCSRIGTGGLTRFDAADCEIQPRTGVLNLRICFTKQTSLKSFRFYRK